MVVVQSEEKKQQIKATLKQTRERRKSQIPKTYTLKIDESHLNLAQKNFLHKVFTQAKWFYNAVLSTNDIYNISIRTKRQVNVKVLDNYETRGIDLLSSKMKAGLHERILEAIKALSALKKKNFKIGKLKFTPEINSIPLPQYKNGWGFSGNRIRIQGVKKTFKVQGLEQIPKDVEFTDAEILRKPSGYYISITVFINKEPKILKGKDVGLDFGIKNTIVTSDGEVFDVKIPIPKKLKRLQRIESKKKKGSKNKFKIRLKINNEYEKRSNKKKDKVNKIIGYLKNNYDNIYIQDELIKQWQSGLFGKQVEESALGAIKARLKNLESTHVIESSFPSTKMCYNCGKINKISLIQRTYNCECGLSEDRDIKSAKMILIVGRHKFSPMEHRSTILEGETSTTIKSNFNISKPLPVKESADLGQ